jgi:large subunit ribosomal protein L9
VGSLKTQGVELDAHTLKLEEPLKELGVFDIEIDLHPDVKAMVKVWVVEE